MGETKKRKVGIVKSYSSLITWAKNFRPESPVTREDREAITDALAVIAKVPEIAALAALLPYGDKYRRQFVVGVLLSDAAADGDLEAGLLLDEMQRTDEEDFQREQDRLALLADLDKLIADLDQRAAAADDFDALDMWE
jgi:hypothetical protein